MHRRHLLGLLFAGASTHALALPKDYGIALGWPMGAGQPYQAVGITGTPTTTANIGIAYTFTPTSSGSSVAKVFSITNKPSWASFNTSTGQLSGTPTGAEVDSNIGISVSDGVSSASLAPFTITVSAAPLYLPGSPAAAWGVRRLVSGYNGFAARFTDASNARTIDIGFASGSDSLDYATLIAWNTANPGTLAFLFPTILYDQTGNGKHLTAVFSTNPVLQSIPSAKIGNDYPIRAAISYSASGLTSQRNFVIPSGLTLNLTAGSTFLVGSRPQSSIIRNVFFELNNGANLFNAYMNTTAATNGTTPTNALLGITANSGATVGSSGGIGMPRSQPGCVALVQSGTAVTVYADEQAFTYGTASTATTVNGEYLGASQVAGGFALNNYDIIGAAAYNSALSAGDVALAGAALRGSVRSARKRVIFDGDSITQSIYGTYGESISKLVESAGLNSAADIWNLGVSAQQAANINSTWAGRAGALPTSNAAGSYTNTVYHYWAGTNDIQDATQTGSQAWTTAQAILTKAKAAGMKTVVGTLLYEGNSARNAERDNYNALVRAAVGGGLVDAVADYQADPTAGTLAATSNTTYYAPDKIHPTSAAYAIFAPIGQAAINSVL